MTKKRVIFLTLAVSLFAVVAVSFVFIVQDRGNVQITSLFGKSTASTSSSISGVKLSMNNEESLIEITEKLLLSTEGALDQKTNTFVPIKKYRITLANEKQPTFASYGIDQSEENYLASGSFSVEGNTLNILIHLNFPNQFVQENKQMIVNQQLARVLLIASSKKANNVSYDGEGAYRLALQYSYPNDQGELSKFPILIVD